MSVIGSNILAGASGQGGYFLTNSLRFRSSASASLTRTPSSSGNQQKFTISFWMKYSALTSDNNLFSFGTSTTFLAQFVDGGTQLYVTTQQIGVTNVWGGSVPPLIRDPSAWYHFVIAIDTTQATAANRVLIYINGVAYTFSGTAPTQNYNAIQNPTTTWRIGARVDGNSYTDGYFAEINYVDGQQLTPSSFGETSTSTGVWIPKKYTGTYGTNGFYLPFTNTSSTSTLGNDFSGNSNTWTVNNISLTAGSTYDSMTDVPTLTSATATNYAVMNPLSSASSTITNGNLTFSGANKGGKGNFGLDTGKWYWENTITTVGSTDMGVGIIFNDATDGMRDGTVNVTYGVMYQANSNVRKNSSVVANYASYTTGDVIGITYDADTRSITFYKNNTSQGSITADLPTSSYVALIMQPAGTSNTVNVNFGQQPFAYTPPTGFNRLNTFNLPTPTIGATASTTANKYFDATTYTGTGSTQNITNSGSMQPDFVWIKNRSSTNSHQLTDSVRGVNLALASDLTIAEFTGNINAFNANGFQLTGATNAVNASGQTYVGWQWRASNATAVTNTAGSITSTVSANTSAGFSIVTYTGNATSGATVGHGLGVAPSMIIVKVRSTTGDFPVYHASTGNTKALYLNLTNAQGGDFTGAWNNTTPTSTVFTLGNSVETNRSSATFVAYCFAQVAGYSAFGSYTGNGSSDGPFVYTGFRPKFVLIKCSSGAGTSWIIYDSSRNTYNATTSELYPNTSGAETNAYAIDFLSNGFKIRNGTTSNLNDSGSTQIYAAFAENPFKYANAR